MRHWVDRGKPTLPSWTSHWLRPGCVVTALATALAFACHEELSPQSLVDKLRLLAIQVEPPEVAPGMATRLSTLGADPKGGGREVGYLWLVCDRFEAPGADPCPTLMELSRDPEALGRLLDDTAGGPSDGNPPDDSLSELLESLTFLGQTAEVSYLAPDGLAELLDIAGPGSSLNPLVILLVQAGDETIAAVKTITVSYSRTPNTNPVPEEIILNGAAFPEAVGASEEYRLAPVVSPSSRESYTTIDEHGDPVTLTESLLVSWFATAGRFADQRTVGSEENRWRAPAEPPEGGKFPLEVTFYVVVRDGRGGVGWIERSLAVEAEL